MAICMGPLVCPSTALLCIVYWILLMCLVRVESIYGTISIGNCSVWEDKWPGEEACLRLRGNYGERDKFRSC